MIFSSKKRKQDKKLAQSASVPLRTEFGSGETHMMVNCADEKYFILNVS